MKSIDSEINELIQMHNDFLENRKNELRPPGKRFFLNEKKGNMLSDMLGIRLRKFVFMYMALIAVFFSASFLVVNSIVDIKKDTEFVNLNTDVFKAAQKGGIVFAFNEALK